MTPEELEATKEAFLAAYAKYGAVGKACDVARIHRSTIYRWLEHDETFSLRHGQAREEYNDLLRTEIRRRAHDGTLKPVFQGGVKVGSIREYSDTLLIFEAKARMPEYREKQQVEISGQLDITTLAAEADARFYSFLAAAASTAVLGEPDGGAEG
ncbi:MAG TPA: hypothetical protein VE338_17355 [Ktedonobacterales bacterium]|nr:hypothetical protein [Ktedonobacterales bacterium]